MLLSRPFRTSLEIACRETPRSWAASACEIQSEGTIDCLLKLVDKVNLLYYTFVQYAIARKQSPIAVYPAGTYRSENLATPQNPINRQISLHFNTRNSCKLLLPGFTPYYSTEWGDAYVTDS